MEQEFVKAKIINRQMLTDDVLELTIETYKEVAVMPWQWALLVFNDEQGQFQRAYSIVDQDTDNEKTMLIFAIKLIENGRWSTALKHTAIGDEISLKGIFWHFMLQNTPNPKVFIGTWVGIVPLLNMAKYCTTPKQLFFSVQYKKDLFYDQRIQKIKDLSYKIHFSRENISDSPIEGSGYFWWRIDILQHHFDPNTEFYLCGKPAVVEDIITKLTSQGHTNIYFEKF